MRKIPLPDIAAMFSLGQKLVAPRVDFLLKTSPRSEFPFSFGRQSLPHPLCVCLRIVPGNMDDGIVTELFDVGSGTSRLSPIGFIESRPPGRSLDIDELDMLAMPFGNLIVKDE
jgi:hypothetical protein